MLKEYGYQESIINKIFKRITKNHTLSQSLQQTQTADIQSEKIRKNINCDVYSDSQIRSTFYAESTLGKLLYKPKDQVTTEDKKSIV